MFFWHGFFEAVAGRLLWQSMGFFRSSCWQAVVTSRVVFFSCWPVVAREGVFSKQLLAGCRGFSAVVAWGFRSSCWPVVAREGVFFRSRAVAGRLLLQVAFFFEAGAALFKTKNPSAISPAGLTGLSQFFEGFFVFLAWLFRSSCWQAVVAKYGVFSKQLLAGCCYE